MQNIDLSYITKQKFLGKGQEGTVWTDYRFIYKIFEEEPNNSDFLRDISAILRELEFFYSFEQYFIDEKFILKYAYEPLMPYKKGLEKDIFKIMKLCKQYNFVLTNIKKDNFMVSDNCIRYVDYGKNIEVFTEEKFMRSIERSFQMLRFYDLDHEDFKKIIKLSYSNKAEELNQGLNLWKELIISNTKELPTNINKILYQHNINIYQIIDQATK